MLLAILRFRAFRITGVKIPSFGTVFSMVTGVLLHATTSQNALCGPAGSWNPFGVPWEALPGCGGPLEGSGTVLGRLLGGSWQAFGSFQEASWTKDRHGYNF